MCKVLVASGSLDMEPTTASVGFTDYRSYHKTCMVSIETASELFNCLAGPWGPRKLNRVGLC